MAEAGQIELDTPLLPIQRKFVFDQSYEVLYSGAFGTGKSRGLCYKLAHNAQIPGSVHGLFRKTRASLTRTTLRTLLESEGGLPPVLMPGSYEHRASKNEIRLFGGGTILYAGCDQDLTIASMNLASAAIDEAIEIDEDEYTMILGRLRMPGPVRQVFMATNPGSPSHFLYKRFYENDPPAPEKYPRSLHHTRSLDNKYLPDDYVAMLQSFTGTRRKRFVEGLWVPFEGLVYGDVWNRDVHVVPDKKANEPAFRKQFSHSYLTGVDWGYTNPAVLLHFGTDYDGRLHLFDMVYERRMLPQKLVKLAVERDKKRNAVFIADPSAAEQIAEFRDAGLTVMAANNKVRNGIDLVMNRLAVQPDGKPRLTISESCHEFMTEIESYQWKGEKDEPIKEFDHAMDAVRYVCSHLDAGIIRPGISGEPEKAKQAIDIDEDEQREIIENQIFDNPDAWV